jgi:outer membrane receptor protein involved in Fe transport
VDPGKGHFGQRLNTMSKKQQPGRAIAPAGLLFATCLLPLKLPASEEGLVASEDIGLPMETVVVTATRKEVSILDVIEAVSLVDAEEIERLAPDTLAEMMRGVPGAYFQQTTPGQGIPIIRGLKGSQILHLVDGMRLNNAFFRNAPNQYLGLVDSYATQRTEVVRGSAPSLYGADAMGGVLLIQSKEPVFDSADWSAEGRLYGSYNSYDSGLVGRAEAAAGHADAVVSGGITYQDHGNRETGGGETVRPSGYEVQAGNLMWRNQLGDASELMLSAQYVKQPRTPRVDELVPGYGQDEPSSTQYWFKPNQRDFLHARFRHQSDSRWFEKLEFHVARQVITDDRLTQDFGQSNTRQEQNQSTLDGITLQFNTPWDPDSPLGDDLVWGFEYYTDVIQSSRFLVSEDGSESLSVSSRFPDGSGMDSAAVYASNNWRWERLSLDAGLRYSSFEITLPGTEEINPVRLTPTDLTGDIHLGYALTPEVHLLANVGRGFRPPNIFDLGTLGSRPGNRFNIPNPNLQPESVWSYDLGIKAATGRLQAELYAWYADYQDKISSSFTGDVTPGGRLVVQSDNLNDARLWGVESGIRYLVREEVQLYGVLNYTRGEETDGGMTVPADRVPPLNGKLGMIYEPTERFRAEPYLEFAGRQDRLSPRDEEDPRIDPQGTAGYVTFNLLLSWQATQRLRAGLRLQNIGDKAYREHGSGIDAAGQNFGIWLDYRM